MSVANIHFYEDAMRKLASFYCSCLEQSETAKIYLTNRGVSDENIKKFAIGYCADKFSSVNYMRQFYSDAELQKLGVFIRAEGNLIDRFHGRLIFPTFDLKGNPISFCGRTILGSPYKYMNSADTEFSRKDTNLFGLIQALTEIYKKGFCFVVEGMFDVILMRSIGYRNTVSIYGTTATSFQLESLRMWTDTIVLILDSDAAGTAGTEHFKQLASSLDFKVHVIELPKGEDPDSMAHSNTEELKNSIDAIVSKISINTI